MKLSLELLSIQNPWWIRSAGYSPRLDKLSNEGKLSNGVKLSCGTSLGGLARTGRSLKFDPVIQTYSRQMLKWHPDILNKIDLASDNIYILRGARGVGKTTIVKLLIKKLIDKSKTNPDNIFYYSCHNLDTFEQLNELIKIFLTWRKTARYKRLFIFIDEVTLIKDWSKGIDYLVKANKFKNTAVVLTGSILHDPKQKKEYFGKQDQSSSRVLVHDKIITSLDFVEFIKLINPELAKKINQKNYLKHQNQLEYYLDIYFLTGGFISAINSFKENGAVKQNIYSNYLYWLIADIAKLGRDIILLRQILEQILFNLGQPIGYKTIARKTKTKTHLTIAEYLCILERMFAARIVYQAKGTSRKAKKVYFCDPFLFWLFYSYIYGSIDYWQFSRDRLHHKDIFSALVENAVFSHLIKNETLDNWGERVTYWRDSIRKQEIDFVVRQGKRVIPILIRHSAEISDMDRKIFSNAGFKKGIIISKDRIELSGTIKVLPLTYFLMFYRDYL